MIKINLEKSVQLPLLVLFYSLVISTLALLVNPQREKTNFAIKSQAAIISCDLGGYADCVSGSTEQDCAIEYGFNIQDEVQICATNEHQAPNLMEQYIGCMIELEPDYGNCLNENQPNLPNGLDFWTNQSSLNGFCNTDLEVSTPDAVNLCAGYDTVPDSSWITDCTDIISTETLENMTQEQCEAAYPFMQDIVPVENYLSNCLASASEPALSCEVGQGDCLSSCTTSNTNYYECAAYCSLGSEDRCNASCLNDYPGSESCATMCAPIGYVADPTPPVNDIKDEAIEMFVGDSLTVDTTDANTEQDPVTNEISNSVWYKFNPVVTNTYTVDLCDSEIPSTKLFIYRLLEEGETPDYSDLGRIWNNTVNDTICTTQSAIELVLDAGKTYFFEAGTPGSDTPGNITIHLTAAPIPQENLAQTGEGRTAIYTADQDGNALTVMTDGNLTNSAQSYNNEAKTEDYWGIEFTKQYNFNRVVFTSGASYPDGGWFQNTQDLKVQVEQSGEWVDVSNSSIDPAYSYMSNTLPNQSYTFTFDNIVGTGVRIYGAPVVREGVEFQFTTIGELEIYNDGDIEVPGHSIIASMRESSDRSGSENGYFRGNFDNVINWTVTDPDQNDTNLITLSYSVDDGEWQTIETETVNDGDYAWFPTPAIDGATRIRVQSTDLNFNTFETIFNVTFDSTLPQVSWNDDVQLVSGPTEIINVNVVDDNLDSIKLAYSDTGNCFDTYFETETPGEAYSTTINSNEDIEITKADHENQYVCLYIKDLSGNDVFFASSERLVSNIPDTTPPTITITSAPNNGRFLDRPYFMRGYIEDTTAVSSIKFLVSKDDDGTPVDSSQITTSCQDENYVDHACGGTKEYFTIDTSDAMSEISDITQYVEPQEGFWYRIDIYASDPDDNQAYSNATNIRFELNPADNIIGAWDFESLSDSRGYFAPLNVTHGVNGFNTWAEGGSVNNLAYANFSIWNYDPMTCNNGKLTTDDINRNFDFSGAGNQFTVEANIRYGDAWGYPKLLISKASPEAGEDTWAMGIDGTGGIYCSFKLTNGVQTITSELDNNTVDILTDRWTKIKCIYNNGTIAAVIGDLTVAEKSFPNETLEQSSGQVIIGNSNSCQAYAGDFDEIVVKNVADSYDAPYIDDGEGPQVTFTSIPGDIRFTDKPFVIKGYFEDGVAVQSITGRLIKNDTTSSSVLNLPCQDENYNNRECGHQREYFTFETTEGMAQIADQTETTEPTNGAQYRFDFVGYDYAGHVAGNNGLIATASLTLTDNVIEHFDFESDYVKYFGKLNFTFQFTGETLNLINVFFDTDQGADGGRYVNFTGDNYDGNSCNMSSIFIDDYNRNADFSGTNQNFTIEAWVKNTTPTGSPQIVFSKASEQAGQDNLVLGLDETNGLLCGFEMTGGFRTISSEYDNPSLIINPSEWTNLKCVYDNGMIIGMINDIAVTAKYYEGETIVASNEKVYIGNSASCHGFVGDLDEVKLYDAAAPVPTINSLEITSPLNNDVLRGGSVHNITWSTVDTDENDTQTIDIDYSIDDGDTWTSITSGEENTGVYMWTVPAIDTSNMQLKVTANDTYDNTYSNTITMSIDSTSPVITWNQNVLNYGQLEYTLNVSATDTNLTSIEYGISTDSTCDASDAYDNNFITSGEDFIINGLENDTKYVCIKAIDDSGHIVYSASAKSLYSIDIAPVITINPIPNAGRLNTTTPTFTGQITDPDGIAEAEYLLLPTQFIMDEYNLGRLDDQNWQTFLPDGGTWGTNNTFTITATATTIGFTVMPDPALYPSSRPDYSQGQQFIYIRAWDTHYNKTTPQNIANTINHKSLYNNTGWIYTLGFGTDHAMGFYKIFIESKDTTAPDILSSPIVPDPTTDRNPSIHGYIKDNTVDKTSNITSIKYKLDDGEWIDLSPYNKSVFNSPNEEFNIQLSDVSVGDHTLTVRAIDASGNDTNTQDKNFVDTFTIVNQEPSDAEKITKIEDFSTREMDDQFNTTGIWGNGYARARQTIQFSERLDYSAFSSAEMGYLYGQRVTGIAESVDSSYIWLVLNDRSFAYYNKATKTFTRYTTLRDGVDGLDGIDAYPGIKEISLNGERFLLMTYAEWGQVVVYDLRNSPLNPSDDTYVTFDSKFGTTNGRFLISNAYSYNNTFYIEGIKTVGEVVRIDTKGTMMNTSDDDIKIWGEADGMQHVDYLTQTQLDTVGLYFDYPKGYFIGTNYYFGGINVCSLTSPVCSFNPANHGDFHLSAIFHIEKDLVQDNLYWLGGNSGLFLYDTKGTLDTSDDVLTDVKLRNVDLAGDWVSEVKLFPGTGSVGEEVFMFMNTGKIRILETNNTPTDLLDDTNYLYSLPTELYRNSNGVSSYFGSKNEAWIFMPGTGLFNISLTRGFEDNNVIELLPSPPQGKLEVNHITLNSVNGSNLTASLIQENGENEDNSFIAKLMTDSATPAYAADPTSTVEYFVSNNNGLTWYPITVGERVDFPTSDYQLRFKAILHPINGVTPVLTNVDLSYALYPHDSVIDPTLTLDYPTIATVGETFDGGVQLLDDLGYTPNWNGTIQLNLVSANQPSQPSTCITHPQSVTVVQGEVTFNSQAVCPGRYQFVGQTVDGGLKAVGHQILVRDNTPNPLCGNGALETGEQCDSGIGSLTCSDFGFTSGSLKCSSTCRFDTTDCTSTTPPSCGNGTVEAGEQCDGNVGNLTCSQAGEFTDGTLSCTDKCQLDTSKCRLAPVCGNNIVEDGELCDGTSVNKTCDELNAGTTGTPKCTNTCTFDSTPCTKPVAVINDITNTPVSKTIMAAVTLVSSVFSISILNLTFFDLPVIVISWWFNILGWLGVRRKGQQFGIVYNSITKEPLSQAIVRIYDGENRLLRTEVTNAYGIFTTQVEEGKYKVIASKPGFKFPSSIIKSTEDSIYTNIYNGEMLNYSGKNEIVVSIPIDPVKSSFSKLLKTLVKNNAVTLSRFVHLALFVLSFLVSIYVYSNDQSLINTVILLLYIPSFALLIASSFDTRIKLGRVSDSNKNAIAGLPLGLKEPDFERLVAKRVTDDEGYYRFIVPKGKYNFELMDTEYVIDGDTSKFKEIEAKQNPSVIAKNFKVKQSN